MDAMSSRDPLPGLRIVTINGPDITTAQFQSCAKLFSEHYGIWAADVRPPLVPKSRVRMSATKLATECFGDGDRSSAVLILAFYDGVPEHVGQALLVKWRYGQETVGWVTQLVVHTEYRRRYVATSMLSAVKDMPWFEGVSILGIASTHAAACNALLNMAGLKTTEIDLEFIRAHAAAALERNPAKYLQGAPLCGVAFGESCTDGAVSLANTRFPVDHAEPQGILDAYVSAEKWILGVLRPGHEFLLVVPAPLH